MTQTPPPITNPEVDRILDRMSTWLENSPIDSNRKLQLSRQDVQWIWGEVVGGREAFDTLVDTNSSLRIEVRKMRQTIDTLMAMRGKPNG
jgi:hypothetical protein